MFEKIFEKDKKEWVVYIFSFLQNMFFMACFTYMAIRFDKWWMIFFSLPFIAMAKYNGEMSEEIFVKRVGQGKAEEYEEDDEE